MQSSLLTLLPAGNERPHPHTSRTCESSACTIHVLIPWCLRVFSDYVYLLVRYDTGVLARISAVLPHHTLKATDALARIGRFMPAHMLTVLVRASI